MYLHIDSKSLLHHFRATSRDWLVPELCRVLRICCLLPFQLLNSLVRSTKFCTLQGKLKIMKHQRQHFPTVADVQENYGKLSPNFPKIISTRFYKCFGSFFHWCKGNDRIPQGAPVLQPWPWHWSQQLPRLWPLPRHWSNLLPIYWSEPHHKSHGLQGRFGGKKLTYADKKWRKIRKNPWKNH